VIPRTGPPEPGRRPVSGGQGGNGPGLPTAAMVF